MQNDILPPERGPNKNITKVRLMRSLRLQGHSHSDAQNRLQGKAKLDAHPPHPEATISLSSKVPSKKHPWKWLKHHLSKRSKIELVALAAILAAGTGAIVYMLVFYHPKKLPVVVYKPIITKPTPPPAPTTMASPLSGNQVDPALAKRPVTGIMIENSPDARPQSGLQDAGVVYEAIAEGGITRFLGLFQETTPQYIGPVRSVRPYYIDFAAPYQASIVHVGGSPDGLAMVRNGHYRDLDQFFNSGYFTRISSRYAPHNVYTDFARLDQLNQAKGYTSSTFTPWPRKDPQPAATPTASHIDIKISSPLYYSHYDFNNATDTYMRSEGGVPHLQITSADDKSGLQLNPRTVLALVMQYAVIDSSGHSSYVDTGSGQMFAFQDGTEVTGTWNKTDQSSMFSFKYANGDQFKVDAGQTWVVIVGSPSDVSYTP